MKTLNKSLLAAAVIGAMALPGLSSAATVQYAGAPQIMVARDMVAIPGSNITLPTSAPTNLTIRANSAVGDPENTAVAGISAGDSIRVKITLVGAEFGTSLGSGMAYGAKFVPGARCFLSYPRVDLLQAVLVVAKS